MGAIGGRQERKENRGEPPPPRPRKVGVAIQRLQVVGGGMKASRGPCQPLLGCDLGESWPS